MTWRRITEGLLIGAIVGLAIYDIAAATNREQGDTISEVTLARARQSPVLALAIGAVCGHLFWPQRDA